MTRNLLSILFLLLITIVNAQREEQFREFREKYPDADAAGVSISRKLDFQLVDGKPEILYTTREEMIYLSNRPTGYSKRSYSSSRLVELSHISATVYTPGENRYRENKVTEFKESSMAEGNIFYDGEKELSFFLPGIERGSVSVIETVYRIKDPHMVPTLMITPHIPVENCELEVNYSPGFDLNFRTFNLDSLPVSQSESSKGKKLTRKLTFSKSTFVPYHSDAPTGSRFSPQLHVRINSYLNDAKEQVNVLRNVDDLHNWYRGFVSKSTEEYSAVKALADSIVAGATSPREKAERLYSWVQHNISYIAIEEGYLGLIPQKASVTAACRYGDCKGMSNLLYSLMRSQGLEAYLTWVGTRSLSYRYEEVASPVVDNHMIVYYADGDKGYFLDPTHSMLSFELPSPFIQGKEALVSFDSTRYRIMQVPVTEGRLNSLNDSVDVYLDGSSLRGTGTAELRGYPRMIFLEQVPVNDYEKLKNYTRSYLEKGSNKFQLDTVWISGHTNNNTPLTISYSFHVPDQVLKNGDELYVNLHLNKNVLPSRIEATRKVPVEFRFRGQERSVVRLHLPLTMNVTDIPEAFTSVSGGAQCSGSFRIDDNVVIREYIQEDKYIEVSPEQFPAWNDQVKALTSQFGKQIIIKSK